MDSHNLATLFGPNLLHKAKGGAFQVESQERAEERVEVIQVVREMIDHQNDIFAVCIGYFVVYSVNIYEGDQKVLGLTYFCSK